MRSRAPALAGAPTRTAPRVTRRSGSSFAAAFWMLPRAAAPRAARDLRLLPPRRRHRRRSRTCAATARCLLERWREELRDAYRGKADAIRSAIALGDAVRRFELPRDGLPRAAARRRVRTCAARPIETFDDAPPLLLPRRLDGRAAAGARARGAASPRAARLRRGDGHRGAAHQRAARRRRGRGGGPHLPGARGPRSACGVRAREPARGPDSPTRSACCSRSTPSARASTTSGAARAAARGGPPRCCGPPRRWAASTARCSRSCSARGFPLPRAVAAALEAAAARDRGRAPGSGSGPGHERDRRAQARAPRALRERGRRGAAARRCSSDVHLLHDALPELSLATRSTPRSSCSGAGCRRRS